MTTHITLAVELGGVDLGAVDTTAWPVAAPRDLTKSHGLDLTRDMLAQMAADYSADIDRAPINTDHDRHGAALGWIKRAWMDGERLMVEPEDLDAQLAQGIRERKWRRPSIEINLRHPTTGRPYLEGLALLGAKPPAIKGLEVHLSADPTQTNRVFAFAPAITPTAEPAATHSSPQSGQEHAMSGNNPAPAATATTGTNPAPATPETATLADLAADRAALAAERDAARTERLAARRERIEAAVDRELEALGEQIPPCMLRHGLREVLVTLQLQDEQTTVQLSANGTTSEVPVAQALLAGLKALPKLALLSGPLANEDAPVALAGDRRSKEQRAFDQSQGITDERAVELQAKFPTLYPAN